MIKFVPTLTRKDVEARAESVLQKARAVIAIGVPIEVEDLLERYFDLRLYIGKPYEIGQGESVLGAIFFDRREVFINDELLEAPGRYRFTLAHEIGHWVLHQNVVDPIEYAWEFVPGHRYRGRLVLCRAGDFSPVERQANMFAAALLMPRWSFVKATQEEAEELGLVREGSGYLITAEQCNQLSRALARHFAVSVEAARYRLEELGLVRVGNPFQLHLGF